MAALKKSTGLVVQASVLCKIHVATQARTEMLALLQNPHMLLFSLGLIL